MHFSGLCKRDTCLFDNTLKICHWMGIEKVQKKQAFLFLSLIVLMPFVPVELFILAIKGKKRKNSPTGCAVPARGRQQLVPEFDFQLVSRTLGFDIKIFQKNFGLVSLASSSLFFTSVFAFLFLSFVSFLGKRVEEFSFWLINT